MPEDGFQKNLARRRIKKLFEEFSTNLQNKKSRTKGEFVAMLERASQMFPKRN